MNAYAVNNRASFDYELLETFETGIELTGHEVKSVKMSRADMKSAHVIVRGGEAFILGLTIHSFQPKNAPENYDNERIKKLLLTKKEIEQIASKLHEGLTVIPVKLYNKGAFIKVQIALARGKKKYDKRETIKNREVDRKIHRKEY
jgi:SsrA-binding protein